MCKDPVVGEKTYCDHRTDKGSCGWNSGNNDHLANKPPQDSKTKQKADLSSNTNFPSPTTMKDN